MLSNSYKIYVKETIELVKSMVIKSDVTAEKINAYLSQIGVDVNLSDKRTWKYYLNISGQYHANDKVITVISSDTQEEITLSKENLANHPITKIEYGPGGIYHKNLLDTNIKMNLFLEGVFSNVDIDTAIAAKDFEILHYNKSYVASNEVELIPEVQQFIYHFADRWNIEDYATADELYSASFYDLLYKTLVTAILNLRTSFCNTSQVCQFHLWSKLKGLYGLDKYKDKITLQQSLWLYRNMRHLILHAGSQYILDDLIEKLANTAGLEAFKYDYVKVEGNLHNSLVPDGRFVKRGYKDDVIDIDKDEVLHTEESILYESISEAPQNEIEFDYDLDKLKAIPGNGTVNQFPTGLLKIEPMSNIITDRFNDQQYKLDYWVYLSALGLFTGNYQFKLGALGTLTLSAKQALILYIYANSKASGVTFEYVPRPRVYNVVRENTPVISDFNSVIDNGVPESILEAVVSDLVKPETVSNFEEFDAFVAKVISRRIRHDFLWQDLDDDLTRSSVRDAVNGVYVTKQVELVPDGTLYLDWLGSIKVADVGISDSEWYSISLTILKTLLDLDPESTALPSSQKAIIDIVDKLSGYAVMVTAGESRLGYIDIDWPFQRTGNLLVDDTNLAFGYLSELKPEFSVHDESEHIYAADLPLSALELKDENADTVDADARTGLYHEHHLEDYTDTIAARPGFQIEVIVE